MHLRRMRRCLCLQVLIEDNPDLLKLCTQRGRLLKKIDVIDDRMSQIKATFFATHASQIAAARQAAEAAAGVQDDAMSRKSSQVSATSSAAASRTTSVASMHAPPVGSGVGGETGEHIQHVNPLHTESRTRAPAATIAPGAPGRLTSAAVLRTFSSASASVPVARSVSADAGGGAAVDPLAFLDQKLIDSLAAKLAVWEKRRERIVQSIKVISHNHIATSTRQPRVLGAFVTFETAAGRSQAVSGCLAHAHQSRCVGRDADALVSVLACRWCSCACTPTTTSAGCCCRAPCTTRRLTATATACGRPSRRLPP